MTATLENIESEGARLTPLDAIPMSAVKTKLAEFWPPVMIAFGVVLTLVWSGCLLWLFLRLILPLV